MKLNRLDTNKAHSRAVKHHVVIGQQELEKAALRIGLTPKEAMRWLMRFTERDLATLSTGDLHNLQYELLYFGTYWPPLMGPWKMPVVSRSKYIAINAAAEIAQISIKDRIAALRGKFPLAILEDAKELQAWAKDWLEQVADTGSAMVMIPSVKAGLLKERGTNRPVVIVESVDPKGPFAFALLNLLYRHVAHLRRCLSCQRIFLADRRNQGYCSAKHQSLAATRRFRKKHGLHLGKRGRPPKKKGATVPGRKK